MDGLAFGQTEFYLVNGVSSFQNIPKSKMVSVINLGGLRYSRN